MDDLLDCLWVRSLKVQTESESTSPDEVELNSATEISTDSEFENDEIIRQTPKIFIDDTHLRKPTKVQVKSSVITPSAGAGTGSAAAALHQKQLVAREKGGSYLQKYQPQPPLPQFKPLVQVDPTLLISSQRAPLQNPRPGDYLLNKTASTEGIASKKSLELKKRYLLGEPANGNKIQKSGSTSVLDSRIRSFQSNISECQKLLNPSSDISAGMKTFLDRTKVGAGTSNVINDLRVELKIQKAPSSTSTDNEKENVFVNSKNELNKGMEYADAVNSTLLEQIGGGGGGMKSSPTTPTNNKTVIEVIDLVTPEKVVETPKKLDTADTNKIIDLTTPVKPDVSKDVKECIPDILGHIKTGAPTEEEQQELLQGNSDEEKRDSPEKAVDQYEQDTVQIQVPNIPWTKPKAEGMSTTTTTTSGSSCSSNSSSSIEDIQHYILESTTSPDTQTTGFTGGKHTVPRVEVHDSSGTLMQVDSLMIVDGKYIGDPEDVKFLDIPEGVEVPKINDEVEVVVVVDDEHEPEPVTATPEPAECTVIEAQRPQPPVPTAPVSMTTSSIKPANLKFDTKNENKIESLKHLPLIVERDDVEAVKPVTLNLSLASKTPDTPTTPVATPQHDSDKTPTGDLYSRGSDSETERTGQLLTETELSDWTADDCISENFVDMEFVLNSNKGTIRRRKERHRLLKEVTKQAAPVATMEGILKAIDIDDIEFMDTGSEGSCAEAYSATNTALLHNRGYMEYIESAPKASTSNADCVTAAERYKPTLITTKRDEKLGIDYIEQGAYIMQDDAKTPVNEPPHASLMTQSLTDSSTLNELDEDSLQTNTKTQVTTTEESEALTVVTSPLDSSSPRVLDPSSSEKQPKTSSSVSNTTTSSSSQGPTKEATPQQPQQGDELLFQFDVVRALQQRISQISTGRESLDSRKHRRKSSKGEAPNLQSQSVIEVGQERPPKDQQLAEEQQRASSKVPEIPTLSSKLEEISKERNKQKDLIHDLVMDKLQSKKQLNAEKRLHRSRQRSLLTSGYASGASLSPTPKLPNETTCSSQAHYHVSTAAPTVTEESEVKTHNPLQKSATYVSPYRTVQSATRTVDLFRQRPFSEHIDLDRYPIAKTPPYSSTKPEDVNVSVSTENLRSEARARARLKSNTELGLSPEEKMQLLRKRLQLDQNNSTKAKQQQQQHQVMSSMDPPPSSGDLAARARKMSASKSVNDLAYLSSHNQQLQQQKLDASKAKAADFTSDPNLAAIDDNKPRATGRRQKDPERRKSLIQSLSSFFHKSSNSNKEQGGPASVHPSEQAERPGTSSSGTPTISANSDGGTSSGGGGGVFSRFRISPKSKEKSKDKDMLLLHAVPATATATTTTTLEEKHAHNRSQKHKDNTAATFSSSSPQLFIHKPQYLGTQDDQTPPPIPPLPLNYQRSDDESYANETREHKKQRAISKASRQAELKRLRIAQEIQREQEEIEVQLKELEARGVLIEKALRGEANNFENLETSKDNDEKLLKELLEIWRNITALKKRDEELGIRQQELQLEYRHAQLKDELNLRLSCNKLDKSSADVAAEGAILNEMLEIVAKRAALRPTASQLDLTSTGITASSQDTGITLAGQPHEQGESII